MITNIINFYIIILLTSFFSIFSEEIIREEFDTLTYYYTSLEKERILLDESDQSLYSKLIFVQNMHKILLDFLYTADDEGFHSQLKLTKPFYEFMSNINDQLFDQIYSEKKCDRRPVEFNGMATYMYYNTFLKFKKANLTDEERTALYEEEVKRHRNILLPKQFLNRDSLVSLIPGQTYNFVLTLANEAYIGYDQRYKIKNYNKVVSKSILYTPNHTILAGDAPVLSAGVIDYYKVGRKELYILACHSGHFQPQPDCLDHMKNYLISLGVPEESIIKFSLGYQEVIEEMKKIKYPD